MEKLIKWIDLSNLPRNNNCINWKMSVGYIISFKYDNIEDFIKITEYVRKNTVKIQYKSRSIEILTNSLSKCNLGKILNKRTNDFKIAIGTHIQSNNKDLIITKQEYRKNNKGANKKYYKFTCNKCGWTEGWINESNLINGNGCACCSNQIVVEGINDIPTTDPWMTKYFQGGYDEAKLYTHGSEHRIYPICPDCGTIKNTTTRIANIYNKHSCICHKCSDGISYPEKFMYSVLQQLNIDFQTQLTKTTFKWCKGEGYDYKYDFYIPSLNCIIETHGIQHYKEIKKWYRGITESENDVLKEQLAKQNGIKNYIPIDTRYSELEWIHNSIINSELPILLNFKEENIDWLKCGENACKNLIKEVCELKYYNSQISTSKIKQSYNLSIDTIRNYLKKGTQLGWCDYNPKEEMDMFYKNSFNAKPVIILKNNIYLGSFLSITTLCQKSELLFGVKLLGSGISSVCTGDLKLYKGFSFKYI